MANKKPIAALVIEAGKEPREATIGNPDSCAEFLDLIGCDSIDCVERRIGGKAYCLTVDDEGLFKEDLPCSGVCGIRERLVGRIVVTGTADGSGSLRGLAKADLERIGKNVVGGVLCYDL
jgi:hypothetical protein